MTRYIIGDTETTGVHAGKEAVEIAMMEIDGDLNVRGTADSLIMPKGEIDPKAQEVHGISKQVLLDANAPSIEQWVEQTFGGPLEGDVTLAGHRVGFDRPLFAPVCRVVRILDTLPLAFEYVRGAPDKKLGTLKAYLGFPEMGDQHRAMSDVWDCYHLIKHLCEVTGRSLEELVTVPYTIHFMPWGKKHAGALLHQVPRSYREWLLSLEDLDPNLRRSLEQVALMDPPRRVPVLGAKPRIIIPKRNFS
jgi:DNA polymerase III epsilon subunit-like protein